MLLILKHLKRLKTSRVVHLQDVQLLNLAEIGTVTKLEVVAGISPVRSLNGSPSSQTPALLSLSVRSGNAARINAILRTTQFYQESAAAVDINSETAGRKLSARYVLLDADGRSQVDTSELKVSLFSSVATL